MREDEDLPQPDDAVETTDTPENPDNDESDDSLAPAPPEE